MVVFAPFITGILLFYSSLYFPVTTGIVFLSGLIALPGIIRKSPLNKLRESTRWVSGGLRRIFWLLLLILSGFFYAFLRFEPEDKTDLTPLNINVKGVFTSIPVEKENGILQDFTVTSTFPFKNRKVLLYSDSGFTPGTEATMSIRIKPFVYRKTPGFFVENEMLTGSIDHIDSLRNSSSLRWLHERLRYRLSRYFDASFREDISGFLQALSIGHTGGLSESTQVIFRRTGLSHILSISGTHFGFLSLLVFGLIRFMINSLPYRSLNRLTLWVTPSEMAALLTLPVVTVYLLLSGMRVPALRSFIMINLFLWGLLLCRKGMWLNSIFFAAFLIELFQPHALFSYSFLLSFVAVLFIGLGIETFFKNNEGLPSQTLRMRLSCYLKKMLILMIAAYLGTLPLVLYGFHSLSLISFPANLIFVPYICYMILPLVMVSSMTYLLTGFFPLTGLISLLTEYLLLGVKFLSEVPYASIHVRAFPPVFVILFYLFLVAFFVTGRNNHLASKETEIEKEKVVKRRVPLFLGAITIASLTGFYLLTANSDLRVAFLDVGQGDASVVELPDGKTIVVDTGKTGKEVSSYLRYRGKNVIDSLLLTHGDSDHVGGLTHLIDSFRIRHLWDNGRIFYSDGLLRSFKEKGTSIRHLRRGDRISTKDMSILVLHPYNSFYTFYGDEASSENNDSLVFKLKGRHKGFLFTGDIEGEAEEDMLSLKGVLQADVLKVAHHGSHTSSTDSFVNSVKPGFSVISLGKWNTYGHPHKDAIERLKKTGILRTDRDGTICFTEKEEGLEVKKFSDFLFKKADSLKTELDNLKRLFIVW